MRDNNSMIMRALAPEQYQDFVSFLSENICPPGELPKWEAIERHTHVSMILSGGFPSILGWYMAYFRKKDLIIEVEFQGVKGHWGYLLDRNGFFPVKYKVADGTDFMLCWQQTVIEGFKFISKREIINN